MLILSTWTFEGIFLYGKLVRIFYDFFNKFSVQLKLNQKCFTMYGKTKQKNIGLCSYRDQEEKNSFFSVYSVHRPLV